jgi:acetyltransferase EpsM
VAGGVHVGEGTWIGAGAVVKQGINIGSWCMIGAGAVVVNDVPDGLTVVGVPARVMNVERLTIND